ncbi:MAG: hypothetical protein ABJZ69_12795, partial [Hyphomicrobiales bacterium]
MLAARDGTDRTPVALADGRDRDHGYHVACNDSQLVQTRVTQRVSPRLFRYSPSTTENGFAA